MQHYMFTMANGLHQRIPAFLVPCWLNGLRVGSLVCFCVCLLQPTLCCGMWYALCTACRYALKPSPAFLVMCVQTAFVPALLGIPGSPTAQPLVSA
jgi:hypothetical protein